MPLSDPRGTGVDRPAMQPRELFTDDDAASPAAGVILMFASALAFGVLLLAFVGTFVGGGYSPAPQVAWECDIVTDEVDPGTEATIITATHRGGDAVPIEELTAVADPGTESPSLDGGLTVRGPDRVVANDTVEIRATVAPDAEAGAPILEEGDVVLLVWEDPESDNTDLIGECDVPGKVEVGG